MNTLIALKFLHSQQIFKHILVMVRMKVNLSCRYSLSKLLFKSFVDAGSELILYCNKHLPKQISFNPFINFIFKRKPISTPVCFDLNCLNHDFNHPFSCWFTNLDKFQSQSKILYDPQIFSYHLSYMNLMWTILRFDGPIDELYGRKRFSIIK